MGRRAAEMLCRRLTGATIDSKRVDLAFEVVLRDTT
jgi:DNA-binding LacI/PurR family transcriptional regulator